MCLSITCCCSTGTRAASSTGAAAALAGALFGLPLTRVAAAGLLALTVVYVLITVVGIYSAGIWITTYAVCAAVTHGLLAGTLLAVFPSRQLGTLSVLVPMVTLAAAFACAVGFGGYHFIHLDGLGDAFVIPLTALVAVALGAAIVWVAVILTTVGYGFGYVCSLPPAPPPRPPAQELRAVVDAPPRADPPRTDTPPGAQLDGYQSFDEDATPLFGTLRRP